MPLLPALGPTPVGFAGPREAPAERAAASERASRLASKSDRRFICPISLSVMKDPHFAARRGAPPSRGRPRRPPAQADTAASRLALVVGKIVEVWPHPDSDKLRVAAQKVGSLAGLPAARAEDAATTRALAALAAMRRQPAMSPMHLWSERDIVAADEEAVLGLLGDMRACAAYKRAGRR